MALILAIEPDRRQAAQLTDLVRTRVRADLVLAETTEGALGAIGNRVPDLVLVPTLLSPQDDAALAGALRVIATAAHVNMLTIPVLADATAAAPKPSGLFARFRRQAPSLPSTGCDPSVFADQIKSYLADAAADRAIDEEEDIDPIEEIEEIEEIESIATLEAFQEFDGLAAIPEVAPVEDVFAPVQARALQPAFEPVVIAPPVVEPVIVEPVVVEPVFVEAAGDPIVAEPTVVQPIVVQPTVVQPTVVEETVEPILETPVFAIERELDEPVAYAPPPQTVYAQPVEPSELQPVAELVIAPVVEEPLARVIEEPIRQAIEEPIRQEEEPIRQEIEEPIAPHIEKPIAPLLELPFVAAIHEQLAPMLEPEPVVEPVAIVEPVTVTEPVQMVVPEPVKMSEPVKMAEPEPVVEPVAIVEPVTVAEPVQMVVPEPVEMSEPVKLVEPEPIVEPVPMTATPIEPPLDDEDPIVLAIRNYVPKPIPEREPVRRAVVSAPPASASARSESEAIDAETSSAVAREESPASVVGTSAPVEPVAPVSPVEPVGAPAPAARAARPARQARPAAEGPSLDQLVAATPMSQADLDMLYFVQGGRKPPSTPSPRKKAKAQRPEWSELVASLRVDVERMKAEGTKPAKRAQSGVRPAAASTTAAPARKTPKPIQDQWGVYDPEQCGFAALLAKLDEITEAPPDGASARVLSS